MASTGLRNLGRSGLRVSPLCLGAMNFGNEQFGCDEKASIGKCCNFENGDGGRPERNWAARFQAARSNSWSMN